MKTDENGQVRFIASYKVSGDEFYLSTSGVPTLPIGTLLIQETKAPEGFLLNSEIFLRQITDDGSGSEMVDTFNYPTVSETAKTSALEIVKTSETGTVSGWKF